MPATGRGKLRSAQALLASACLTALLAACAGQQTAGIPDIPEGAEVKDLYIVDCLLPGQVRQLGNTTYMTPRRPVQTTAQDCRIRGGEYVAYDRSNYKTALKVWLPAAEEGDAEAQNMVGEIFEQGLGTEPNYEVAALWYKRAAEQGHKGAQFNLGTLYETGQGVPQDKQAALNWYRAAWGISDDALVYKSDAQKALIAQAELYTQKQEDAVAAVTASATAAAVAAAEEQARLERELEKAQNSRTQPVASAVVVSGTPASSEVGAQAPVVRENLATPEPVNLQGKNFGRYYALVIGNGDYTYLDKLSTSVSDAQRVSQVLKQRYGFQVKVVTNGDDASLLRALNQMNSELTPEDNLLIYYTGWGNRRESGSYEVGYWLPVNSEPPPDDTFWVPTSQISSHLARLPAKRIMVVADSSFAGLLADNPAFLLASSAAQLNSEAYVSLRFPNKARLLMTSGKDCPLPATNNERNSVFADAFIEVLENNDSVLTAPALYLDMIEKLESRQPELAPEFKAIKRAGDEVGDFFFVARQS